MNNQKCKNVIELLKVRYSDTNAGAVSKVRLAISAWKNPKAFFEAEDLIVGLILHNRRLGELTGRLLRMAICVTFFSQSCRAPCLKEPFDR